MGKEEVWVIKKFNEEAWKDVKPLMGNISPEEYTRNTRFLYFPR